MGNSLPRAAPPPPGDHRKNCSLMVLWQLTKKETRRVCKRKKSSNMNYIMSLPDDLLFEILVLVPTVDIYRGARFVCKKWYNIIHTRNFVYTLLRNSSPGLVVRYNYYGHGVDFWTMRGGKFVVSTELTTYESFGIIWAGCNGLLLETFSDPINTTESNLYIINPLTKQRFDIPPLCTRTYGKSNDKYCGMAYAAASMQYKLVQPYSSVDGDGDGDSAHRCAILTVGVGSCWRQLRTEHLSPTAKKLMCLRPLTTEGFIHWVGEDTYVLTLNIETEIFSTETPVPRGHGDINLDKKKYCLSTGTSLSLFISSGDFSFEVWEMKPDTGEWTKSDNVDLAHGPRNQKLLRDRAFRRLVPIGWLKLKHQEVLILRESYSKVFFTAYNVRTQEIIDFFASENYAGRWCSIRIHTNSLVYPGAQEFLS